MSARVLLLGSGAREHALAWKLTQSPLLDHLFICPGNGGTVINHKCTNVNLKINDFDGLVKFGLENQINLVIPGPEQPLVDGVESYFRRVGIPTFGPSLLAARMEGSKALSKAFMAKHNIPTAAYKTFTPSQYNEAVDYIKTCGHKLVIKASGLAAGKGVLLPETEEEAVAGLKSILIEKEFGGAGDEVVLEEFLTGPELSVLAFSDGYTITPLPAAQDHKRIREGDTGPNTGGMGAYAPAPIATPNVMDTIQKETLEPTIRGMRHDGFPFVGLLFTGFILTKAGPKVLEYNVRFGDPETEALMMLLEPSQDLLAITLACVEHRLDAIAIRTQPGVAVSVVLASAGYPGSYEKGKPITIGSTPSNVNVFHAGTLIKNNTLVTDGGRVIAVTAYAATLEAALEAVYQGVDAVHFEGKTYRKDIAHRALMSSTQRPAGLTYAQAGVSVSAGNDLVTFIKPYVRSTRRVGADAEIGGFGGSFDLKACGYTDPVLVSGTDGVGTKLRVALECGKHDTVGIDLVAMSVNDLIVQGAEPLYFLDYFACSKLDVAVAGEVIKGIAEGCKMAGCALIGGETAEMPGMYQGEDYDLAGFAVGAVERSLILPQASITPGDILLGLPSSGLHSNGFSLVRKIISVSNVSFSSTCPWEDDSRTLGEALLTPTRIYIKELLPLVRQGLLKGMSHITGGGFIENIPRVLPSGTGCSVDVSSWTLPPVFRWLMKEGGVAALEMCRTFNCGVGMVLVVKKENVTEVVNILGEENVVWQMGQVVEREGVEMKGLESWN